MEKGIKSRRKILEVAFKLFAAYSYPDVSYSLLEEASGISRGSMVYYFNNKEGIFRAVLQTFLFNMGSATTVPAEARVSLKGFCNAYVDTLLNDVQALKPFRIANISDARFTIERSALQFVPEFRQNQREVIKDNLQVWQEVVENAVKSGEIKPDLDVEALARLFLNLCYGWLYTGIYNKESTDNKIENLRTLLGNQYKLIAS